MRVILNDHIDHLGERGDVVEVKPGYARNYLLPKGLAYLDSDGNRRRFEEEQKSWEEMDLDRRSAAEKMAADMDGTELLFERRAGEKDVLFGSVNVADIGRALADLGFNIDRRRVLLGHPIKELGSHNVDVRVHRDITVSIPVHVVRPGDQPEPIAEEFESTPEAEAGTAVIETTADAESVESSTPVEVSSSEEAPSRDEPLPPDEVASTS